MARTFHHGNKAKERRFGADWRWLQTTPSWWIRTMMTRPQRREVRRLVKRTRELVDYEDAPLFPLAKKPLLLVATLGSERQRATYLLISHHLVALLTLRPRYRGRAARWTL